MVEGVQQGPVLVRTFFKTDTKFQPEFEGSVVRWRPYRATQDQSDDIERKIQECIDAGLVEEYKHGDGYPHRSMVRSPKRAKTTQGGSPTW